MRITAIEIIDGPLAGRIHEMPDGLPPPDLLGLREDDESDILHWHRVEGDKAYYMRSERRPPK